MNTGNQGKIEENVGNRGGNTGIRVGMRRMRVIRVEMKGMEECEWECGESDWE